MNGDGEDGEGLELAGWGYEGVSGVDGDSNTGNIFLEVDSDFFGGLDVVSCCAGAANGFFGGIDGEDRCAALGMLLALFGESNVGFVGGVLGSSYLISSHGASLLTVPMTDWTGLKTAGVDGVRRGGVLVRG